MFMILWKCEQVFLEFSWQRQKNLQLWASPRPPVSCWFIFWVTAGNLITRSSHLISFLPSRWNFCYRGWKMKHRILAAPRQPRFETGSPPALHFLTGWSVPLNFLMSYLLGYQVGIKTCQKEHDWLQKGECNNLREQSVQPHHRIQETEVCKGELTCKITE